MRSLPSSEAHGGPIGEVYDVAVREAAVVPVETLGVMGGGIMRRKGGGVCERGGGRGGLGEARTR